MNDPAYLPRRQRTAPADPDDLPRRGRPAEEEDENLSKVFPRRGKPVEESTAPPRRPPPDYDDDPPPHPARVVTPDDLPTRRPGSGAPRPSTPALNPALNVEHEPDGEPESSDMNLITNKQRTAKLLTAEWERWGRNHRQEFEDSIVDSLEPLFSGKSNAAAEAAVRTAVGNMAPPASPAPPVVEDEPEPED